MAHITDIIDVVWCGYRKNSKSGKIHGYFVETGKPQGCILRYYGSEPIYNKGYEFWGDIGNQIYIEDIDITLEFITEISTIKKNYRDIEFEKILSQYKSVATEFEKFITFLKLKNYGNHNLS